MENNSESRIRSYINKYLSREDISTIVQRITSDSSVEILNYTFNPFSDIHLGFFGSHWNLKITIQRKNAENLETLSLFLKCKQVNTDLHFELIRSASLFEKESNFFEKIIPELTKNYKIDKWVPNCYLTKPNIIVMENLCVQEYKMFTDEEPLFDQFEMLKLALGSLARFHSCSILTEAHLSRKANRPVTLPEHYPNSFTETFYKPNTILWDWFLNCTKVAATISERFGHNSSILLDGFNRITDFIKESPNHCNAVCHGDLWTNNIMFNNTKSSLHCLLVDFQYVRYAPLVTDILQLLYLNTSKAFRKQYENKLIGCYQSVLEDSVRKNNLTNDIKVPTLKEILNGCDEYRVFGSLTAIVYFEVVLNSNENLKENLSSTENFKNFMNADRSIELIKFMEEDASFRKKFEEVLTESIELLQNKK